jgi:N4-gp56 family major capsid protein
MATVTYGLNAWRLGKYKGVILKTASTREVLAKQGRVLRFPQNNSDTYVSRRYLPYGATTSDPNTFFGTTTAIDRSAAIVTAHQTVEGVTSTPDAITPQDVTAYMYQYDCLYSFTDKTEQLGEDDIPEAMAKIIANRVALVNEMRIFGVLKAGTNIYYGGSGTSRLTTNGAITLGMVRKITANLQANHGDMVTQIMAPGKNYGTQAVEGGYFVYGHTNLAPDIRDMPGFTKAVEYASGTPLPNELGAVEMFRFILSPEFVPILDGGATVASAPGYQSNLGTRSDVYQFIVTAADAWSNIAVRGMEAIKIVYHAPGEQSKSDVFGQRGYSGAMWWAGATIENNGWMAVGNVLAKSLV